MNALRNRKKANGFTLVETIVGTLVGLLIVAASYMVYISQQEGFVSVGDHSSQLQSARTTIDQMARLLRQVGFGVISGEVVTDAKKYEMTFRGDIDADVEAVLTTLAGVGAMTLSVDLDDSSASIDASDYILIRSGETEEMVQVRQSGGEPFSLDGEPDTIHLATGLTNAYPGGDTIVRTVETVTIAHEYTEKEVTLNGETIANNVTNLEIHYFNDSATELVPSVGQSLSLTERTNIRTARVIVDAASPSGEKAIRRHTMVIDLRNMEIMTIEGDSVLPSAPSGLTVTEAWCGHFTVEFSGPTTNDDGTDLGDLSGYKIYYGDSAGNYWEPAYPVGDEASTSVTVVDRRLAHGVTYYVAMVAYDSSDNTSQFSSEVSFALEDGEGPDAPIAVQSISGINSNTLTWDTPEDNSSDDIYGYRIYRGSSPGFSPVTPIADENSLSDTTYAFTDADVDSCITYYYKVAAVDCVNVGDLAGDVFGDADGSKIDSPDNGVTSTTPVEQPATAPAMVDGAAATGGNELIKLGWINPADSDLAGVVVRWASGTYPMNPTDGSEVDEFGGAPSGSMNVLHEGLTNGQTYYYSLFAYDACGNYSYAAYTQATPGANGPVVQVADPAPGTVISNGQLVFELEAYDSDETTLADPPDFSQDNGEGIQQVMFAVTPSPEYTNFPRTEYQPSYCAYGGDTNPCIAGDISNWCDGTYQLYGVATDNEGVQSQSDYVSVTVKNGGLYPDESTSRTISGTYKNEVTFRLENTASDSVTARGLVVSWDRSYARLVEVQSPPGNTIWSGQEYPSWSGWWVWFDYFSPPVLTANETADVKLVFNHWFDTLTNGASIGHTRVNLTGSGGTFQAGDTIYISDGTTVESATVETVGSGYLDLTSALENTFDFGAMVSQVQDLTNSPMASATLTVALNYELEQYSQLCTSSEYDMTVVAGPVLHSAYQDEPATDTASSQGIGSVQVFNFLNVPVHVKVTDNAMMGMKELKVHYSYDDTMGSVSPTGGYASRTMTWSDINDQWEGTIASATDSRVWYYFTAEDNLSQMTRLPEAGEFTYDHIEESVAPACPIGLEVTMLGDSNIALSWQENSEDDVRGYNIFRTAWNASCGSYSRVYTLVTDSDPNETGVQYWDTYRKLQAEKYCYGYYIIAEDMDGNLSEGCETLIQYAGACPCN
jgi:type II secretory pathway pseudopilin PulG